MYVYYAWEWNDMMGYKWKKSMSTLIWYFCKIWSLLQFSHTDFDYDDDNYDNVNADTKPITTYWLFVFE